MARFVTGKTFGTTETVTAALLNQAVNDAKISTDSVDGSTIELNSDALRIKDNGVTLAKMATQADQTVLGNVSGGSAVPTAVPIVGAAGILVNNDSLGTDDTKGATQGNVKAYVDNLIGTADKSSASGLVAAGSQGSLTLGVGLIIKFGVINKDTTANKDVTFVDSSGNASPFPNGIYGVNVTPQHNSDAASETASVTSPTVSGFSLAGYHGVSNSAIGRVFFVAYGF